MVFNFKVPERIENPIEIIRNLNHDAFFDEIKACVGEDLASKLRSKKTINLDADDDMKYDSFRRRIGLQPEREPLSDFDILLVTKAFAKKDLFEKYLAQIEVTYKDELSKLKAKEQAPKEQKAGFDTGDGLAQNINANPVSDNKSRESATGLTFDTVPAPIKINKFGIWCEEIDTFLTDVESLHERKDGRVWLFAGKETSQNPFTEVIKAVYLGEDKDVDVGWQNDKDKVRENISRLRERNNAQEIGDIIFWHLLALAVDDDLWRNNIANVTDWAYCLGFDTQMLHDWCQMVRYVLEGNKLGAYCRYVVKTEQGKKYFHIDCAA